MSRVEVTDEQIHAAQAGDGDAMWQIVEQFDGMFRSIIRGVASGASADDAEDYLQEARAVLIQHIRDYDSSSSSAQLSSYVYRAVRRTIAEADVTGRTALTINATDALRVRRVLWECGGSVDEAWDAFRTDADPTKRMSRERFIAMIEALGTVDSLDAPVGDSASGQEALTLADVTADPSSELTDLERRDYARWLMTQIPQRQSLALRAFYGVNMTSMQDGEAAAHMGINRAALRRLRSAGTASARKVANVHSWLANQAPASRLDIAA